jgi:hypothetical protein
MSYNYMIEKENMIHGEEEQENARVCGERETENTYM